MKRPIRIDTLQWFIGIYLAIRGTLMLMLPHKVATDIFAPFQPYVTGLGALQVMVGAALIGVATLLPLRWSILTAHFLAGVVLFQIGIGYASEGKLMGVVGAMILGLALAIAPFLSSEDEGRYRQKEGKTGAIDLFAVAMGLRMVIEGLLFLILLNPKLQESWSSVVPAYRIPYTLLYLGIGVSVVGVQFYPKVPRWLFQLVHFFAGVFLWTWILGRGFSLWNGVLSYGGLGTALAFLPWIGKRLNRLDPHSLQTRVAVASIGIVTLPLLSLTTLVSLPQEQATIERSLAVQQSLAVALSQDMATYINLHRSALIALANHPGLVEMEPEKQESLLKVFHGAYPDIMLLSTFNAKGQEIARSDNQPLGAPIGDTAPFQEVRLMDEPLLNFQMNRTMNLPVALFLVPLKNSQGEFAGVIAGSIASSRIMAQLGRMASDTNLKAYLVDKKGRVIAHPNMELVNSFADFAHVPPVAALLNSPISLGKLSYWNGSVRELVGYARVPAFGWGAIVERPAEEVLGTLNVRRERDFVVLLAVATASLAIGGFLSHRLTHPLRTLAFAAQELGQGNSQAPLPRSNITELANLSLVFGTMRDRLVRRTQERDRAEAELRQSEAKFRRLVESNIIGAIVVEIEGPVLEANDEFLQMMGYTRADLASGKIHWLEIAPPESFEGDRRLTQELQETGAFTPFEMECIRADGGRVPVLLGAARLEETADKAIAFVLDLTERKQMEREREQLLKRERAAREDAESANRIKDEFLAVLSHELRSPLNPILGWAKLLRSRTFDQKTIDKALETIERNALLQTQLIEDLLDVSRILRGKLTLNVQPVNLISAITGALETVSLAAEAKSIHLETRFDKVASPVAGDVIRLQQVFWNLLSNAVKFTPANGKIEVILGQVDSMAQIQVKDTGKGIAPQFLPYVFEYFRQEDGGTTRSFGGLGLGLAIVRYIVEQHGGSVMAESPGEGLGSSFTVHLPLMSVEANPDTGDRPPLGRMENLQGLRVLLVDDEPDLRELGAFTLEQAHAQVTSCATAAEALIALHQNLYDLLVCDIGMPDVDGYMFIRQVRSFPPELGGKIPAIALTAYASELDRQQALLAGFQLHLSKPIEPDLFIQAIAQLLQTSPGVDSK
ncbi:hybrid sensor histidine kinase/response regulator [Laspinema olomoucense]|uniref:histidine kinase n=1 Tax=Laspinema olomoucense D3b TaxID=2953688 RepID=A0ABT2NDC3_9CYAN|nr:MULTISPECIES: ATP-binding protein [unclassified Laspinema]MCT7980694.1 ATP-binding protein [Laspinema sp. D3b]MCT7996949.1 ATP-binding protein [Laspinema sp. D3c]